MRQLLAILNATNLTNKSNIWPCYSGEVSAMGKSQINFCATGLLYGAPQVKGVP